MKLLRRLIRMAKFLYRYVFYRFMYAFNSLGWPIEFSKDLTIFNEEFIKIGNNVNINEYVALKCITDKNVKNKNLKITIGDRVGIGMGTQIVAAESITIEDDVILAPYCFVGDFDHEYEDTTLPVWQQPLRNLKPITIKKGAWIGTKSTVCAGVTIGKNSVIGANSVVTKDVPDYSVAAGIPARVLKKYNQKTKKWEKI